MDASKVYEIVVPSCDYPAAHITIRSMDDDRARFFDGTGAESFSWLVNQCIRDCKEEILIIASDRVEPTQEHVQRLVELINDGFGIAGLYRFAFFGFKLDLIRRIGFFDERLVGGGLEDSDMIFRLREAGIAYYEKEHVPYKAGPTRWAHQDHHNVFNKKWLIDGNVLRRKMKEPDLPYDIGPPSNTEFLPWDRTELLGISSWFKDIGFEK